MHQGDRENPPKGTLQNAPVTSGEGVPRTLRSDVEQVIEASNKRAKRLFNKNTGLCEGETLRIGADTCPVPEG